ncbi:MAG TPA: alpha/beta fold hydrolase [Chitinophagales bacterium]|nr:alpha/beta fold hydrolase [Chitinophagales bacterium]
MLKSKLTRRLLYLLTGVFVLMNVVAFFHAYKFTHFTSNASERTKGIVKLTTTKKLKALFMGMDNPHPVNKTLPAQKFETFKIKSNVMLECWSIKADSAKGMVILFHGYTGTKSAMLDKSDELVKLGYSVWLVDFMGSGGSEGNRTTVGVEEAREVKDCYEYAMAKGEQNICLLGTSMGAAAILKAVSDYKLQPAAIILECPFGTMYETTCARFRAMHVPAVPMAALLDFWGGVQNGFWAFSHNPIDYARAVHIPTLLMYGEQDARVSRWETDSIFANLAGVKQLKTYPLAGHESYMKKYRVEWTGDVDVFLRNAMPVSN